MTKQEALNTITLDTQEVKEDLTNRIVELNKRFYDKDGRVDVPPTFHIETDKI